jgi:hypothetical protein
LPAAYVVTALRHLGYEIMEVITNNPEHDTLEDPAVAVGGFEMRIRFNSLQEAIDMISDIELDGHRIRLWHRGRYLCKECNRRGHTEDYHAEFERATKRNREKRDAYYRRKAK